jgi:hypothetical protein
MKYNDRLYIIRCILKKNIKEWLQILLFSFLLLLIIMSITAYYSYQKFGNIMLKTGINAHELKIYGIEDEDNNTLNSILNINNIVALEKEYETYNRAKINSTMIEVYSIPDNLTYISSKVTTLKQGEMIASDYLELTVNGKKLKGKKLIGKTVTISIDEVNVTKIKIVDVIDSTNLGVSKETAFLSKDDMIKIANEQEKQLDEYTSLENVYIAFINDSKNVSKAYKKIKNLDLNVDYMVSADTNTIKKININILLSLLVSSLLFFIIKLLYLHNYLSKEKNNISIYLTCGYSYNEISKIYENKNFFCSLISIAFSEILYLICLLLYNNLKKELVAIGLKAILPWYLFILVWSIELIINIFYMKWYFNKIKKMEVSEFICYD